MVKVKVHKIHPRSSHEGPEGQYRYEYKYTLSLTSVQDVAWCSTPCLGHFTTWNDPVPILRRQGGPQHRCGRVRKILAPPEFDPRTVQPVASFCTD